MVATPHPNAPSTSVAKRKLRNFLIDKRFQLTWVARVAFTTALLLGVMGYFLYRTLDESTDMLVANSLAVEGMAPQAQQRIIEAGEHDKRITLLTLALGLALIATALSLMTIVATHKIAGPAMKMKKLLAEIDGDRLQLYAKLRRGDELQETFQELDDMLRRLRESRHRDLSILEEASALLPHESPAADKLRELVSRYRSSVDMH